MKRNGRPGIFFCGSYQELLIDLSMNQRWRKWLFFMGLGIHLYCNLNEENTCLLWAKTAIIVNLLVFFSLCASGFPLLWRDTVTNATRIRTTLNCGWLTGSEVQSIIIKARTWQHPCRHGTGGAESSTSCSKGKQKTDSSTLGRASKPTPQWHSSFNKVTPPNNSTPCGVGTLKPPHPVCLLVYLLLTTSYDIYGTCTCFKICTCGTFDNVPRRLLKYEHFFSSNSQLLWDHKTGI